MTTMNIPSAPQKSKPLARARKPIHTRYYSLRTEDAYLGWIKVYISFHGKCHPSDLGTEDVTRFPCTLVCGRACGDLDLESSLSALLFLYPEVLQKDLPWLEGVIFYSTIPDTSVSPYFAAGADRRQPDGPTTERRQGAGRPPYVSIQSLRLHDIPQVSRHAGEARHAYSTKTQKP